MSESKDNHLYETRSVTIKRKDEPFAYCDTVTSLTNNLENAALFRIRQVMFAVSKDPSELSQNELEIMNEIENALPLMGCKYKSPTKGKFFLSYEFWEKLFKVTGNPDRNASGLSNHTAQNAIKSVVRNMKSYFAALRTWKKSPELFNGKPEIMRYHRKGGHCTAVCSNQESKLHVIDGCWYLKLPYRKGKSQWIPFGKVIPGVRR